MNEAGKGATNERAAVSQTGKPRRSKKTGLPPGSLVHVGEKKVAQAKITVLDYTESGFEERQIAVVSDCLPYRDSPTVTWINIDGLHEVDVIEALGKCFNLHPLTLEDVLTTSQRPKLEDFGDYLYLVLNMIYRSPGRREIVSEQVSLVLGPNWVLSLQEEPGDTFDPVRERIRGGRARIRKMGADYLAYSLLDSVVDNYFAVLENIGERIEVLEEDLVAKAGAVSLKEIHDLKRQLIFLRKSVWPLREAVNALIRGESALVGEATRVFLRDVYDHTVQVIDSIETFRDMVAGMLDIYLSTTSNKLNEIMKVLTIMSTIFIPLTFIAGVYGMNFRFMPELEWRLGYPVIMLIMSGVGLAMVAFFRRKKWL